MLPGEAGPPGAGRVVHERLQSPSAPVEDGGLQCEVGGMSRHFFSEGSSNVFVCSFLIGRSRFFGYHPTIVGLCDHQHRLAEIILAVTCLCIGCCCGGLWVGFLLSPRLRVVGSRLLIFCWRGVDLERKWARIGWCGIVNDQWGSVRI